MMEHDTGLGSLAEPMREPLERFTGLIRELGGKNAKALTLLGAIAAGAFDPQRHTARSVLVLEYVDLSLLRQLAEHGVKLGKNRIASPLIMTPDYIKSSLDTFPLELIDIQQNHITVFGEDYFADLSFDDGHVRLQCERELKTILIGLRQGLLAAAGREKFVGALEQDVGEGLVRILRGLLWLKGQRDVRPAGEVIAKVEKLAERSLPGIRNSLDPTAQHGWDEFEMLYHDVEALGEMVDAW
jgi:hypothetical protein